MRAIWEARWARGLRPQRRLGRRCWRASDRVTVPLRPGNAGGGKSPDPAFPEPQRLHRRCRHSGTPPTAPGRSAQDYPGDASRSAQSCLRATRRLAAMRDQTPLAHRRSGTSTTADGARAKSREDAKPRRSDPPPVRRPLLAYIRKDLVTDLGGVTESRTRPEGLNRKPLQRAALGSRCPWKRATAA